jgi:hypothetical protein
MARPRKEPNELLKPLSANVHLDVIERVQEIAKTRDWTVSRATAKLIEAGLSVFEQQSHTRRHEHAA